MLTNFDRFLLDHWPRQLDDEKKKRHRKNCGQGDVEQTAKSIVDSAANWKHRAHNSRMSPSAMSDGHHHTLTPTGKHVVDDLIIALRGTWQQVFISTLFIWVSSCSCVPAYFPAL